jgi:hypothetical protein
VAWRIYVIVFRVSRKYTPLVGIRVKAAQGADPILEKSSGGL